MIKKSKGLIPSGGFFLENLVSLNIVVRYINSSDHPPTSAKQTLIQAVEEKRTFGASQVDRKGIKKLQKDRGALRQTKLHFVPCHFCSSSLVMGWFNLCYSWFSDPEKCFATFSYWVEPEYLTTRTI